jgi:TolB-like protein
VHVLHALRWPGRCAIVFLTGLSLTVAAAQPEQSARQTIAVMDFQGMGMAASDASSMTDRLRFELLKTKRFDVMERNEMNLILQEQAFQQTGCVDQSCAVEAGKLIAVRKMVAGSISKVGGIYTVNAKLLDVESGRVDMNVVEDCDCPVEQVLTRTLARIARQMAGLPVEETASALNVQRGDASLFIKTDPSEASVYFDGKLMDGRTPLTLENLTAGQHTLMCRKAELQAKQTIDLEANKVVHISLSLGKIQTVLKASSTPSEAEVYLGRKPGVKVRPDGVTPGIFPLKVSGPFAVTVFKVGYCDTTVTVDIAPNEVNGMSVELVPCAPNVELAQKHVIRHRTLRRAGRVLIGGALAAGAAAGVLAILGQRDYDDARAAREWLELSTIGSGAEYDAKLKENQDKSASGDAKSGAAIGLGAVAALGLTVGLVFYF